MSAPAMHDLDRVLEGRSPNGVHLRSRRKPGLRGVFMSGRTRRTRALAGAFAMLVAWCSLAACDRKGATRSEGPGPLSSASSSALPGDQRRDGAPSASDDAGSSSFDASVPVDGAVASGDAGDAGDARE